MPNRRRASRGGLPAETPRTLRHRRRADQRTGRTLHEHGMKRNMFGLSDARERADLVLQIFANENRSDLRRLSRSVNIDRVNLRVSMRAS
jgi:hypothetical protein